MTGLFSLCVRYHRSIIACIGDGLTTTVLFHTRVSELQVAVTIDLYTSSNRQPFNLLAPPLHPAALTQDLARRQSRPSLIGRAPLLDRRSSSTPPLILSLDGVDAVVLDTPSQRGRCLAFAHLHLTTAQLTLGAMMALVDGVSPDGPQSQLWSLDHSAHHIVPPGSPSGSRLRHQPLLTWCLLGREDTRVHCPIASLKHRRRASGGRTLGLRERG